MITAKEAKELVENSENEFINYLEKTWSEIRQIAEKGGRELLIDCGSGTTRPPLSYKNKRLSQNLAGLGFIVNYMQVGDNYVPKGLADDDGNGPEHHNYGLVIRW